GTNGAVTSQPAGPQASNAVITAEKAQAIIEEVRKVAKERATGLNLDSNIMELGLDSLERMEILASLEERFGGRFPQDVLPELETCRQVLQAADIYLGSGQKRERRRPDEIPVENYRLDKLPEYVKLRESLDMLEESGLANPFFHLHEQVAADTTVVGGRE